MRAVLPVDALGRRTAIAKRDDEWPDEQAQESKGDKATEYAQNGERHRHVHTQSDEPGLEEIVYCADQQAPADHQWQTTFHKLFRQPGRRGLAGLAGVEKQAADRAASKNLVDDFLDRLAVRMASFVFEDEKADAVGVEVSVAGEMNHVRAMLGN